MYFTQVEQKHSITRAEERRHVVRDSEGRRVVEGTARRGEGALFTEVHCTAAEARICLLPKLNLNILLYCLR